MVLHEIQSDIETVENNARLYEEANFAARTDAEDYIEFNILDRIDGLLQSENAQEELIGLKRHAERIKERLEAVNDRLFQRLRADIRMGHCTGTAFKRMIDEYIGHNSNARRRQDERGYDSLDAFVSGLLLNREVPAETKAREPEMVFYQPTQAHIIFELVEKACFLEEDVFFDVGSGLGQVSILANLLSGVRTIGVEFEPAFSDYATACAAGLYLSRVAFRNVDARSADFSGGTVFFMYTPFVGALLQEILDKLREESRRREIKLFTYGPCTSQVSQQSWLTRVDQNGDDPHKLAQFKNG